MVPENLRHVTTCSVPKPAYEKLRHQEKPFMESAREALSHTAGQPLPDPQTHTRSGTPWGDYSKLPLAVSVTQANHEVVIKLAKQWFNDDLSSAGGWLVAKGVGLQVDLPTQEELKAARQRASMPFLRQTPLPQTPLPPLPRPEPPKPLPPDDMIPNGDSLRKRREAAGLSQRNLAAASGLSRGLVSEIENGHRSAKESRLILSKTLDSLTKK